MGQTQFTINSFHYELRSFALEHRTYQFIYDRAYIESNANHERPVYKAHALFLYYRSSLALDENYKGYSP